MNSKALDITEQGQELAAQQVETEGRNVKKSEICFGVLMAVGALSGIWYAVSLMISFMAVS